MGFSHEARDLYKMLDKVAGWTPQLLQICLFLCFFLWFTVTHMFQVVLMFVSSFFPMSFMFLFQFSFVYSYVHQMFILFSTVSNIFNNSPTLFHHVSSVFYKLSAWFSMVFPWFAPSIFAAGAVRLCLAGRAGSAHSGTIGQVTWPRGLEIWVYPCLSPMKIACVSSGLSLLRQFDWDFCSPIPGLLSLLATISAFFSAFVIFCHLSPNVLWKTIEDDDNPIYRVGHLI